MLTSHDHSACPTFIFNILANMYIIQIVHCSIFTNRAPRHRIVIFPFSRTIMGQTPFPIQPDHDQSFPSYSKCKVCLLLFFCWCWFSIDFVSFLSQRSFLSFLSQQRVDAAGWSASTARIRLSFTKKSNKGFKLQLIQSGNKDLCKSFTKELVKFKMW